MPPAPALASRRVAAWPASVISVLARRPMRVPRAVERDGAEEDRVADERERPRSTSASASQPTWPCADALARRRGGRRARGRAARARPSISDGRPRPGAAHLRARDAADGRRAGRPCGGQGRRVMGGRPRAMAGRSLRAPADTRACPPRRVRVIRPHSALRGGPRRISLAALVEEEVRHHRARHARGELGGERRRRRCARTRSSSVTMPVSRPPSTTTSRRTPWRTISSAASSTSIAGSAVITGEEAWSAAWSPKSRPSAITDRARSRSVTNADRLLAVDEHDRADVALAHQLGDLAHACASGAAVTTDSVMTSRISTRGESTIAALWHVRTPAQLARRRRVEAVIRVAAPLLDLVLFAGDRVSRVAGRNDVDPEPAAARRCRRARPARRPAGRPDARLASCRLVAVPRRRSSSSPGRPERGRAPAWPAVLAGPAHVAPARSASTLVVPATCRDSGLLESLAARRAARPRSASCRACRRRAAQFSTTTPSAILVSFVAARDRLRSRSAVALALPRRARRAPAGRSCRAWRSTCRSSAPRARRCTAPIGPASATRRGPATSSTARGRSTPRSDIGRDGLTRARAA